MNALRHSGVKAVISLKNRDVVIVHYMKADWCSLALCSLVYYSNFAIWFLCFWCILPVFWFMLGKHRGKAENARKWVWMDDPCVSHTLTIHSFCCNGSRHSAKATLKYLWGWKVDYLYMYGNKKYVLNYSEFHIDCKKYFTFLEKTVHPSI